MKVTLSGNDLLIEPETEFEETFLQTLNPVKVFHKKGLSVGDYVGIKIKCNLVVKGTVCD